MEEEDIQEAESSEDEESVKGLEKEESIVSSAAERDRKIRSDQPVVKQEEKVLITGDDTLIEYVDRLIKIIKTFKSLDLVDPIYRDRIEKFVIHYVWHEKEPRSGYHASIVTRLDNRLQEMLERRRRLHKHLAEKDGNLDTFKADFADILTKKREVIRKFSAEQLEGLLKSSTKNIAYEVVSTLIPEGVT